MEQVVHCDLQSELVKRKASRNTNPGACRNLGSLTLPKVIINELTDRDNGFFAISTFAML